MGFIMCSVSILGADTEIEQYNKNLMSHFIIRQVCIIISLQLLVLMVMQW